MTDQAPVSTQPRFRRAMVLGAVAALVLFAWSAFLIVHFNGNPASARFGVGTLLKLASVFLPGPVLLLFLAWRCETRASRILGWLALVPTVAAPLLPAYYTTTTLRPVFATAAYDDAARDAEAAATKLVNADAAAVTDVKAVRQRFAERPTSGEELAALARRMRANAEQIRRAGEAVMGLRAAVVSPFLSRGVSVARADEFARIYIGPVRPEAVEKSYADAAASSDALAERLEMLATHAGAWSWGADGAPVFSDEAVGKAYRKLH